MTRYHSDVFKSWLKSLDDEELENEYYRLALFYFLPANTIESLFSVCEEVCVERGFEIIES